MSEVSGEKHQFTRTEKLIILVAIIGFAFDIYELLMLPLIARPALMDLAGVAPGTPEFGAAVGQLFYIPALVGGIVGLFGGWLTDRFGRRRVLLWSVMIYSFSPLGAAFSTSLNQLLFFRCTTFIGVCVEFVAAVAWLAELFPEKKQREKVLGNTQAFSSAGGLMVAVAYGLMVKYAADLPAIPGLFGDLGDSANAPWRYTLITGLIPAIPIMILLPFLPESPKWKEKRAAGTLKRPSIRELFSPELRRTTIVTTLMFAMAYGAAFGALQQVQRIVPGLPQVEKPAQEAKAKAEEAAKAAGKEGKLVVIAGKRAQKKVEQTAAAKITKVQEIGGLYGRAWMAILLFMLLAGGKPRLTTYMGWSMLVVYLLYAAPNHFTGSLVTHGLWLGKGILFGALAALPMYAVGLGLGRIFKNPSTRTVVRMFQVPGLVLMPFVFGFLATKSMDMLYYGVFITGFLTIAQFTFWGNYLPRAFPLHLRGTGESFAANIGGRLVGTCFAWVTATIAVQKWMPGGDPYTKLAYTAAGVAFFVYLVGFIASFWLPEPVGETLDGEDLAADLEDKKETAIIPDTEANSDVSNDGEDASGNGSTD